MKKAASFISDSSQAVRTRKDSRNKTWSSFAGEPLADVDFLLNRTDVIEDTHSAVSCPCCVRVQATYD